MAGRREQTQTGGRPAISGVISGDFALSVGMPSKPAPPGWRWVPLCDFARLETGHTPSRRHPEYWGGDVPWIGIKDATENHGRVILDTIQHTNDLGIENSSARILPANTVCLSRTASVGYVVVMGRPMATSQDFVNWVCADDLDYQFLKYVLLSERSAFLRFASGTTHQTIYFPEVKAFHVCLPALPEQRAIAHILSALDEKIELNQQLGETLEAMARALFKSWFEDFDPVRDKAEGSAPNLPIHVSDLFPSRFVDSELGEIPEGWRVGVLDDVLCELEVGGRPKGGVAAYKTGVPSIGAESIAGLGVFDYSKTKYVPRDFFDRMTKGHIKSRDVLLYKDGGRPGEFEPHLTLVGDGFPFEEAAINEHVYRLRAKPEFGQEALLFGLSSERVLEEMRRRGTGVAVPGLNSTQVRSLTTLIPPPQVTVRFTQQVEPHVARILAACCESRTLATLRDTLLPKLISGDLRVKDAEKFIGRSV